MKTSAFLARPRLAAALVLACASLATQATVISTGSTVIPGSWIFDFDAGVRNDWPDFETGDIFWEMVSPTERRLVANPYTSAFPHIAGVGAVDFASLTDVALAALPYGTAAIPGGDAVNTLVPGYVFAVQTGAGNYAKVLVTGPFDDAQNHGLAVQWVTYTAPAPVPEPSVAAMLAAGLAVTAVLAWRRRGRA